MSQIIFKKRECSKKSVRQDHSRFDARSVLIVRERSRPEEGQACEPEGPAQQERRWRLFSTFFERKEIMSLRLKDKVAVITGGNSGIGLASAKLFQAEGARVIITGRRKEAVDAAVKEIGGAAKGIVSDTGSLNDITSLYEQIQQSGFKIDVLFLNAGIAIFGPFDTMNETAVDAMININFKGLFFNIQKAAPVLNDGASIIINSSIADQKGFPNTNIYAATKAAVRSLARTLSTELLERKIRVNSLAPGPIDTPIFDKVGIPAEAVPEMKESFAGQNPMKRMGTPDEIAKSALFLASNDSSYITGIDLTVDGGMTQL